MATAHRAGSRARVPPVGWDEGIPVHDLRQHRASLLWEEMTYHERIHSHATQAKNRRAHLSQHLHTISAHTDLLVCLPKSSVQKRVIRLQKRKSGLQNSGELCSTYNVDFTPWEADGRGMRAAARTRTHAMLTSPPRHDALVDLALHTEFLADH